MALRKSLEFWIIFILGLFYISSQCEARAVNVSNTWTMPPEGLNVFYRFFRDRISWFEADAVCQFHHANLVTVDNSFQFDATRDLLRDLDVNDIVWIGLMRPQSSERFMWSNSRPLAADTGYWAESLPLMDAPLCAVIDPIRDYRWHALRCGGPETASFLCEMPVPSWADACIIKDMPALTMQYMADTASIDLIRNCGEEGLLRQSCRGKEDRERVIGELICPKERYEAQRINDITSSHFKSLQIINSIPSDNNENNNIELLPLGNGAQIFPSSINDFNEQTQTEKNTVQRLIEQFNVDELMQADQPAPPSSKLSGYRIPGEIPKPVKKMAKKAMRVVLLDNLQKKQKFTDQHQQQQQQLKKKEASRMALPLEDMMMGDQPADGMHGHGHEHKYEDNETSNEIMQPLPHIKKVLPQDLRKKLPVISEREEEGVATTGMHLKSSTTTSTTLAPATTTTMSTTTTTEAPITMSEVASSHVDSSAAAVVITSTLPAIATATIGHPMHPQQLQRSIVNTEEVQHPHIKESADSSHFIPPMLMVKSHYVPPTKHEQREQHQQQQHLDFEQNKESVAAAETQKREQMTAIESTTIETTTTKLDEGATATTITATSTAETTKTDVTAATKSAAKEQQAAELLLTAKAEVAPTEQFSTEARTTTTTKTIVAAMPKEDKLRQEQKEKKKLMIEMGNNKTKQTTTTAATPTTTTTTKTTMASTTMAAAVAETTKTAEATIKVEQNEEQQQLRLESTTEGVIEEITTIGRTTTTIAPSTSTTTPTTHTTTATPITAQVMLATTTAASATATTATDAEIKTETSAEDLQDKQEALTTDAPAAPASTTTITATPTTTAAELIASTARVASRSTQTATTTTILTTTTSEAPIPPTTTHNFLNEETETPFKPNRRRSLTKPETASYFKKILG